MSARIFTDWTASDADAFGKKTVLTHHRLHEDAMFSDDGLADLLDRYPREKLGIYTMGHDPKDFRTFRKGTADSVSGADLLEVAKAGRIWLNLRAVNSELSDYSAFCDDMFGELEAGTPGLNTFKRDMGVLISSPDAQVFYHLDVPLVMLWQIRGRKRVWLYPPERPFVSDMDLERVVLRETEEEFEYDASFDAGADMYDLEPGQMVTWPQNAPHRVHNHSMMNVSLSVEFMTWPAIVRANAIYANGVLRRLLKADPRIDRDGAMTQLLKAGFARVFKAVSARKAFVRHIPVTFHVDPNADGGIRNVMAPAE